MGVDFNFFTPTELPIVGERLSQIKCMNNGENVFTNAEVIASFPSKDGIGAYIIVKATFGTKFIWEVYINESNLNTWRFKY